MRMRNGTVTKSPESEEFDQILASLGDEDPAAMRQLLPLVYDELRRIANAKLRREAPGITLQTTDLVHEAFFRLTASEHARWENRAHFFGAAAESMRRVLIDRARRRKRLKRGGDRKREVLHEDAIAAEEEPLRDIEAIDAALKKLEQMHPLRAEVVKLRFYAGMTIKQTADILGISEASVTDHWKLARAWLYQTLTRQND